MPLWGAALMNAKHSSYYLINAEALLNSAEWRAFMRRRPQKGHEPLPAAAGAGAAGLGCGEAARGRGRRERSCAGTGPPGGRVAPSAAPPHAAALGPHPSLSLQRPGRRFEVSPGSPARREAARRGSAGAGGGREPLPALPTEGLRAAFSAFSLTLLNKNVIFRTAAGPGGINVEPAGRVVRYCVSCKRGCRCSPRPSANGPRRREEDKMNLNSKGVSALVS